MPQVPRYGAAKVETQLGPAPQLDVSPSSEAFGASLGRALPRVGEVAERIAKVKDDVDQVAAIDALNQAKQQKTKMLYDPKSGALAQRGKNAFNVQETHGEEYKKFGADLEKNLGNESQRAYFRERFSQEAVDFDQDLGRHVFSEAQKFEEVQSQALIENYKQDAILNFANSNKIRESMQGQEREIFEHAARAGLPEQYVKQKIQETHSATHSGVVQAYLLNDQDRIAKAYFEANKDDLTAKDRQGLERDLEEAGLRGNSMRAADSIFAKNSNDYSAAIREAKKIEDPKLRDETTRRLEGQFAQADRAKRDQVEKLHVNALNMIDQTGDVDFVKIPGWQMMSAPERESLKAYASRKKQGQEVKTDWVKYYDLMLMAQTPELNDKFLQENLLAYRNELSDAEFKQLVSLQSGLRKNDSATKTQLDGYRTDSQIVDGTLREAGYDTGAEANDKNKEAVGQFRRKVDELIFEHQQRTGKKANNQEVQQIVDQLLIKGSIKGSGWLWDSQKRVFELTPEEAQKFNVEIPDDTRSQIEGSLKKKGIPVTDESVARIYLKSMRGGSGGR